MNKLYLCEDEDIINDSEEEIKIPNEKILNITTITNLISDLIKDEWEAINGYNSAILTLSDLEDNSKENCSDVIEILRDIASEEYVHIGQLEKALQSLIPETEDNMEKGEDEAEELLDGEEVESEEENEEDEKEEELPSDDVDEGLADNLFNNVKRNPNVYEIFVEGEFDEPHYEVDVNNGVYAKVYPEDGILGHFGIEQIRCNSPEEREEELEKLLQRLPGNFNQISVEEFRDLQNK